MRSGVVRQGKIRSCRTGHCHPRCVRDCAGSRQFPQHFPASCRSNRVDRRLPVCCRDSCGDGFQTLGTRRRKPASGRDSRIGMKWTDRGHKNRAPMGRTAEAPMSVGQTRVTCPASGPSPATAHAAGRGMSAAERCRTRGGGGMISIQHTRETSTCRCVLFESSRVPVPFFSTCFGSATISIGWNSLKRTLCPLAIVFWLNKNTKYARHRR